MSSPLLLDSSYGCTLLLGKYVALCVFHIFTNKLFGFFVNCMCI